MANAQTEHSKKLRAKTAAEWSKKQLAEGHIKRMTLQLPSEVADLFDEIATALQLSRPQTLKAVLAFYQEHKSNG